MLFKGNGFESSHIHPTSAIFVHATVMQAAHCVCLVYSLSCQVVITYGPDSELCYPFSFLPGLFRTTLSTETFETNTMRDDMFSFSRE